MPGKNTRLHIFAGIIVLMCGEGSLCAMNRNSPGLNKREVSKAAISRTPKRKLGNRHFEPNYGLSAQNVNLEEQQLSGKRKLLSQIGKILKHIIDDMNCQTICTDILDED